MPVAEGTAALSAVPGRASWLTSSIASATGWLAAERLFYAGLTVTIGFWMARHLGPDAFGTLGYITALVTFIAPITSLGLHGLLMRDLIGRQSEDGTLLGTAMGLRLLGGVVGVLLLAATVTRIDLPTPHHRTFVMVLSVGSVFQAVGVIEYWLQSRGGFRSAAVARMAAAGVAAALRLTAIVSGAPLSTFVWIAAGESALLAGCFVAAYMAQQSRPIRWTFSRTLATRQLSESVLVVVSGIIAAIYLRIDQVMLAKMAGPEVAGIYTAASRLTEAVFLVPTLFLTAAFPTLLGLRTSQQQDYLGFLQRGYDLLAIGAVAVAALATLLAGPLIHLLYGDAYAGAAAVLVIHIWASVPLAMHGLVSKWMIAENLLRFSVLSYTVGALVNIAANLYLIPRYGAVGAAWSALIACGVGSYLVFFVHPRTRGVAMMMSRAPFAPLRWLTRRA